MLKKSLLLLLLVSLLSFGAGVAGGVEMELTLERAVDRALEYSLDYQIMQLNKANADIDAQMQALQPVQTTDGLLRAELVQRRAEQSLADTVNSLVVGVITDYFAVKRQQEQLTVAQLQMELAEHNFGLVSRRVDSGDLHPRNLTEEEIRFSRRQVSLRAAEQAMRDGINNLLFALGEDGQYDQLQLVSAIPSIDLALDLDETLALAEKTFAVWEREVNARLAALDLEKTKILDPAPLELQKAENTYNIASLNRQLAARSFEQQVSARHRTAVNERELLGFAITEYELAQEEYGMQQRQFAAGLLSEQGLISSKIGLTQAQISLHDAQLSYLNAMFSLMRILDMDIWPLLDTVGNQS